MTMVLTMLVLLGILAVTLLGAISTTGQRSGGVLNLTDNALQSSAARTRSTAAFNTAESGLQYTLAWLETRPAPPVGNAQAPTGWDFVSADKRGVVTPDPSDPGTYFSVRLYPDAYNADVHSTTSNEKKYLIEVIGVSGGQTSIVQAYVRQGSLAQYLVLLNSWNDPNNFWVAGLTTFDGPVHDNNANGQPENILWKSAAGTLPMFNYTGDDAYSTSGTDGGTGVKWWKDQFGHSGDKPQVITNADGSTTNQWKNVAAGGAGTVKSGTPVIKFPESSDLQKNAVLGTAPLPTTPGVTLCPGGGIYINGDADEVVLSAAGPNSTTQVITITQGTTVQRVTIDPKNGTLLETQKPNGTWKKIDTQSDVNGVVYINGNVGSQGDPKTGGLHGVVADNLIDSSNALVRGNRMTIATPQDKNMNLDGSVTYSTTRKVATDVGGNPQYIDVNGNPTSDPAKGTPVFVSEDKDVNFAGDDTHAGKAGTLGLISKDVKVTQQDSAGKPLNKFEMDGTVLASGLYDADHFADRPVGLWENMGGYLSSTVGTFGQFDNSLTLQHGFNTQFNYDARMRNTPPPFFPTTGNVYSIVSWQQVAAPLE